jgi:hypothetical protein
MYDGSWTLQYVDDSWRSVALSSGLIVISSNNQRFQDGRTGAKLSALRQTILADS